MRLFKRPCLISSVLLCASVCAYLFRGFSAFLLIITVSFVLLLFVFNKLSYILLILFVFSVAVYNISIADNKLNVSFKCSDSDRKLDLTVLSDTLKSDNASYVTVKSNGNGDIINGTKFTLYFRSADLKCGDRITADVKFFKFENDNMYSVSKGVFGSMWLKKYQKDETPDMFYKTLGGIRRYIKDFLYSNCSEPSADTLTAILLGDKSGLTREFDLFVKRSGVSHIMAVSGLHLSVILGFIFFFLFSLYFNRFVRFFAGLISVFAISAVCGFTPSVLRAGLMFVMFAFAMLLKRDADILNTISGTVLIIIQFSPLLLFNISFQMSALAIIAVMFVSPFYCDMIFKKTGLKSKILKAVISAVIVSVMAGIFTMPVAVYNFGYISLVSLVTNILITLAVTAVIVISMISLVLSPFKTVSAFTVRFADWGTEYINAVINYFGSLKYAAVTVPLQTLFIPLVIMVLLVLNIYLYKRRKRKNGNIE